jgi:hypothetical protein
MVRITDKTNQRDVERNRGNLSWWNQSNVMKVRAVEWAVAVAASHQGPSGRSGGPAVDGTGPGGLYLSQMAPASEISSASVLFCPDRPPFSPLNPDHTPVPLVYWSLVTRHCSLPPKQRVASRFLPAGLSLVALLELAFLPDFYSFFS